MNKAHVLIVFAVTLIATALSADAQTKKAGLWEISTTMSWQQSPFPAGMNPGGGMHVTQICVTQAQIDKYGSVPPEVHGDCKVSDVVKKTNGMTAEMICTGHLSGKGSIVASWTDAEHSTSQVHFVGTMQMGPRSQPYEWTASSTAVFKKSDCGSVKPAPDTQ
jgi:hypothetical protein